MRRRSFLVASLILATSAAASAGTIEQPILGGTQATVGQYPSVVAIEVGGGLCTGTLIDKDWVLTAAHCLAGVSPTGARVHFGTVNLTKSGGNIVTSAAVYPKPTFNESALGSNDIGLIKLSKSVTDIAPLPVNLYANQAPIGVHVTMVGFGATGAGATGSVGVEYVVEQTSTSCAAYSEMDANLLCFNQTSGTGKCNGDSGGPSFAMINGRMTQVGITSFGDNNCTSFGADTRTDAEKAYLLQYIPQLECTTDADCPMGRMCFLKKCISQPFSPGGLGSTCTTGTDCDSGTCAMSGKDSKCSMTCTVGDATTCPDGLDCVDAGGTGACWPPDEHTGCCDTSGQNASSMLLGIALFGSLWTFGGRRKRR